MLERWVYGDKDFMITMAKCLLSVPILTHFVARQIIKNVKNYAYGQGMGRHSKEEVRKIGYGDLKALSDFLGKFFLNG